MKRNCTYLLFILMAIFVFSISSCEKKEEPITLPKANDSLRLFSVSMGPNYDKQIFLNLDNKQETVIENNSWDLYFDADANGKNVYINGGKGVLIAKVGSKNFTPVSSPQSLKWQWDAASGDADSLALGDWYNNKINKGNDSLYMIDRGSYITDPGRYMQFKITHVDANKYKLTIANADASNQHEVIVNKDASKAHVYLSFDDGGKYLNLEPDKNNWHLCFLRYRWVYYQFNPPLFYTVTGIYINDKNTVAAADSTLNFNDIDYNRCASFNFNSNRDAMGFDWKVYNFTSGRYVSRSYVNYIIRTTNPAKYYKLRFIDFYDDNGLKGTPRFEVQGF